MRKIPPPKKSSAGHKDKFHPFLVVVLFLFVSWTGAGIYQLLTTGQSSILLVVIGASSQISNIIGKF